MIARIILLFLLPLTTCIGQELNVKYNDTLVMFNKDLNQCIKEHSDEEMNCRKEYYHALKYLETQVYFAVLKVLNKNGEEKDNFAKKEGEWTDSSYWYFTKTHKEFQAKHPKSFVWDKNPELKPEIRVFYKKNCQYFIDRINYLLNLVKDK